MSTPRIPIAAVVASLALLGWGATVVPEAAAITPGQIDTFTDGTTQGWREGTLSPNPPTNVASGGPAGAGDRYLQNVSTGGFGAGSKMVLFNTAQWAGDFVQAGVVAVQMDLANLGATPLNMRVGFQGGLGLQLTRFVSTNAVPLPADGQWRKVAFNLVESDMTRVAGTATLAATISQVTSFRILSASAATWTGDPVVATLGIDNIEAMTQTTVEQRTWNAVKAMYRAR